MGSFDKANKLSGKKTSRDEKPSNNNNNNKQAPRSETQAKEKKNTDDLLMSYLTKYKEMGADKWTVDQLVDHLESEEIKNKSEKVKSLIFTAVRAIGGAKPEGDDEDMSDDDMDFLGDEELEEFPFDEEDFDMEEFEEDDEDVSEDEK